MKSSTPIQDSLKLLLEEYESQFAKDETSIGTTLLMSMTIDTGTADPVLQKPYPIAMKHYEWVKNEIEKLLAAKVICSSQSSWSAPIIVVLKGDGSKHLVIDYKALNKVTTFVQDIITSPWTSHLYPRQHLTHPSGNTNM